MDLGCTYTCAPLWGRLNQNKQCQRRSAYETYRLNQVHFFFLASWSLLTDANVNFTLLSILCKMSPPENSSATLNGNSRQATNGHSIGASPQKRQPLPKYPKPSKKARDGTESHLSGLMKLRAASRRPLPTEMGDGTYRFIKNRPSLFKDLRSMSYSGRYTCC